MMCKARKNRWYLELIKMYKTFMKEKISIIKELYPIHEFKKVSMQF